MNGKLRLNLHCHSNLSDGVLSPEDLAGRLADGGATIAALTDHDTVAGLPRFREALSLRGVAFVDAVELTTFCSFGEIHILAYGIDTESAELATTLAVLNNSADQELQSFMERIRRMGNRPHAGRLDTMAALDLVHRCGGIAILAHPLNITYMEGNLDSLLDALLQAGLDGIEAFYDPYTTLEQERLFALAESRGLCVSMGTDFHVPDDPQHRMVMETDEKLWRLFRDRLLRQAEKTSQTKSGLAEPDSMAGWPDSKDESVENADLIPFQAGEEPANGISARKATADSSKAAQQSDGATARLQVSRIRPALPRLRLGKYSARIVGAAVVSLGLFVLAIFAFSIPYFEKTLLERKKEMIRELTAEAVSLIAEYAADETTGRATREVAQANAIAHIRDIRYGREGKDYFWITDLTPRMLMHPYRNDLEGKDVSNFQDDNGLRVFYEFTRAIRDVSEGYVEYLWQWKDDSHRIVPKLSFVKRFAPWGWVIGTGIYLDDVQAEIGVLTSRMIWLSILIAAILLLLLVFIAYQSLRMEKEKQSADFAVRESRERYRALVDASSEGMVIVMDGACTFANAPFLALSSYTETEVVLLGISEFLVPYEGEEEAVVNFLATLPKNGNQGVNDFSKPGRDTDPGPPLSCLFRTRFNELVDVVLYASAFSLAGKKGAVLSVKDARVRLEPDASPVSVGTLDGELAELISLGTVRARLHRRAGILGADRTARRMLGMDGDSVPDRAILGGYFGDPEEWDAFYDELISKGRIVRKRVRLRGSGATLREVMISARVENEEAQGGPYLSAVLESGSNAHEEIEALRERVLDLEQGLIYLDLAIPITGRRIPSLPVDSTVRQAASLMTRDGNDALLVEDTAGTGIGIITDEDLRLRVVADGRDAETPLGLVMSSPLIGLREGSTWGQALHLMREKNIGHIAVRDGRSRALALVGRADLLELQADVFQALLKAASGAGSLAELERIRRRMAERVLLLASSGTEGRIISAQFSSLDDAIISRLFSFAELDVGPAPARFTFLNLGSGGRAENLPGSDQDNAIVYLPDEEKRSREKDNREKSGREQAYFLRLGTYICDALNEIGAPWCPGGVMAKNEAWCAPLDTWERKFASWIASPEGVEMLSLNMGFDFRPVYGDTDLAAQLRKKVGSLLTDAPAFFTHLASEALRRRTTFPQTGNFFQGGMGEAEVDLKELASQFVLYTRLYALRDGIGETNTWSRIRALADSGAFGRGLAVDCMEAYGFVSRLRIEHQADGPKLSLKSLRARDEAGLKEAFAQAALIQKKIGFDFPGAALG